MEEVADVTITDHYEPTGNSGEFKLRPVKQITDSLIAALKIDLVKEMLEVLLLPVNIFVHSFTELQVGNFNTFVEKATQRKQYWLEEYITAREQDAKADETLCTGGFGDHIKVREPVGNIAVIITTQLPRILDPRFSNLINPPPLPPFLRSSEDRNHLRLPARPSAPRWVCRAAPACLVSGLHKNVSKMLMGVCSCMLQCCSAAVSVSSSWCDS